MSALQPPPAHGVVAVGASAGGVEALSQLAAGLPPDLPYAVLVTLHLPANSPSVLPRILDRAGPLPAVAATDGARIEPGCIYVAVPDRHLLTRNHHIVLSEGPTENGHRPAINALFRSVAVSFGARAVSVLLSGVLDDGTRGSAAIRARGGTTIAQDPDDAMFPPMPTSAIDAGVIDHIVPATQVGALLTRLAERTIEDREMEPDPQLDLENRIAMGGRFSTSFTSEALGPPSDYTCPDCNGSLMTIDGASYRCRVGHAWTAEALLDARDAEVENALWIALRSLQEKARLSRRLADSAGSGRLADRYLRTATEAERALEILGARLAEADTGKEPAGDR